MSFQCLTDLATLSERDQIQYIEIEGKELLQRLSKIQDLSKDVLTREEIEISVVIAVSRVLQVILLKTKDTLSVEDITLLTEVFRVLRNCCADCKQNQEVVQSNKDIVKNTNEICVYLIKNRKGESQNSDLTCLRCAVQFLGNAVTGHSVNQDVVWQVFFTTFVDLLSVDDAKLYNYVCMVIFNCMKHESHLTQLTDNDLGTDIVQTVINQLMKFDAEWGLFMLEVLLEQPEFLKHSYTKLTGSEKSFVLEVIMSRLKYLDGKEDSSSNTIECKDNLISQSNMSYICEQFKLEAYKLLRVSQSNEVDELEPLLVKKHLECLCLATASSGYSQLKCDIELLSSAINLLHCMKALGENGENVFSDISKMSQTHITDEEHPVFGMKKDLIRLVSNMAYKNKINQDKVRELAGISLILDHTNIDGRNPYITQYAVFAIRNLCDNNLDNQGVIAGLKLEGVADNIEQLRQYGVEAEVQGDKVVIKTVSKQAPPNV